MKHVSQEGILLTLIILALTVSCISLAKQAKADGTTPTIYMSPQTPTINSTLNFTLAIKIGNVYQMTEFEVHLDWNPAVLNLTKIVKGTFLSNNSQIPTNFYKTPNYVTGTLACIEAQVPAKMENAVGTGAGNATLFTLTFTAVGTGQCTLHLHDTYVIFVTSNLANVAEDGYFNNQQVTYPFGGVNYNATITSNSTAYGLNFNDTTKTFSFNVSGPAGTTGYINITIPKNMLDVDPAQTPYVWEVILDGVPQLATSFSVTTNATHTFIYFTYTHSDHSIAIIGNKGIPDTIIAHQIVVDGVTYNVITLSNSTIVTMNIDTYAKSLNFTTSGTDGTTGYVNLTIPKTLLNCPEGLTYWHVMMDNTDVTGSAIITQNSTHTFVYFAYSQSTHDIHITGTYVVPESILNIYVLLIMLAAVATLPLLTQHKKHQVPRQTS